MTEVKNSDFSQLTIVLSFMYLSEQNFKSIWSKSYKVC